MGDVHHLQMAAKVCGAVSEDLFERYPNGIPVCVPVCQPENLTSEEALFKELKQTVDVLSRDYPLGMFETRAYAIDITARINRLTFYVGLGNRQRVNDTDVAIQFQLHCGSSHSAATFSWEVCHKIEVLCEHNFNGSDDSHDTIELTTPQGWGDHHSVVPVELFMASLMVFVQKFELVFGSLKTPLLATV